MTVLTVSCFVLLTNAEGSSLSGVMHPYCQAVQCSAVQCGARQFEAVQSTATVCLTVSHDLGSLPALL